MWAGTFVKREVNNSTRLFLCDSDRCRGKGRDRSRGRGRGGQNKSPNELTAAGEAKMEMPTNNDNSERKTERES